MSGFSGYMPVSVNSIVFTVPSGQWSGSGSDYYFTVQAPNVTTDSMLDVCYDNASKSLFSGTSLWVVASNGSFTVHVDSVPAGDVTIKVRLEGVVGEAQYQVLSDVYSKSQTYSKSEVYTKTETNSAISQSTASAWDNVNNWLSSAERGTCNRSYFGKVVSITFFTESRVHAENDVIMTLPEAWRPKHNVDIPAFYRNGCCVLRIGTDGVMKIWLLNDATNAGRIYGSFTLIVP